MTTITKAYMTSHPPSTSHLQQSIIGRLQQVTHLLLSAQNDLDSHQPYWTPQPKEHFTPRNFWVSQLVNIYLSFIKLIKWRASSQPPLRVARNNLIPLRALSSPTSGHSPFRVCIYHLLDKIILPLRALSSPASDHRGHILQRQISCKLNQARR